MNIEDLNPYMGVIKICVVIAAVSALAGGALAYHHHVFEQGVTQEKDRRDKIDAANTIKAQSELAALNEKLRLAHAALTEALATVAARELELHHEQAISADRQSDLLAGRARERVLVTQHKQQCDLAQVGQTGGASAASVDQGAGALEDLDPGVAANLERIRTNENNAIDRLEACSASYDAVKSAADKLEKP